MTGYYSSKQHCNLNEKGDLTQFLLKILFKILIMDQAWQPQHIAFNLSDTL